MWIIEILITIDGGPWLEQGSAITPKRWIILLHKLYRRFMNMRPVKFYRFKV
jgi:hypothetical protein